MQNRNPMRWPLWQLAFLLSILPTIAFPNILYVKMNAGGTADGSSWTNAFTNLQSALLIAQPGDEIWVAAGHYLPTVNADRNASFHIPAGVAAYGGFIGTETDREQRNWTLHNTTLSGNIGDQADVTDNVYTVVFMEFPDTNTVLDGFIIEDGYADGASLNYYEPDRSGGGIYVTASGTGNSATPILANCTIRNNYVNRYGGGIMGRADLGGYVNIRLTNCRFENNTANFGGAVYVFVLEPGIHGYAPMEVSDCEFVENHANLKGAGLFYKFDPNTGKGIVVKNSHFLNNSGDGLVIEENSNAASVRVENCLFEDTRDGLGLSCDAADVVPVTVKRCRFWQNEDHGPEGSGAHLSSSENTQVTGCTFIRNIQGLNLTYGGGKVDSCYFANNHAQSGGALDITYCRYEFSRCAFFNNSADLSGGVLTSSRDNNLRFYNNLFVGNTAENGAVLWHTNNLGIPGKFAFVNCTFVNNSATFGGVFFKRSQEVEFRLTNCIFYQNTDTSGSSVGDLAQTSVSMDYCMTDIANPNNLFVTGNNANVDIGAGMVYGAAPEFADLSAGDLRLLPLSTGVDIGSNDAVDTLGITTDFAGHTRIQGIKVDFGAFETLAPFSVGVDSIHHLACAGDHSGAVFFDLLGLPPFSYHWDNGQTTGQNTTGLDAGQYSFTVSDNAGNMQALQVEITAPAPMTAAVTSTAITCIGANDGEISINVSGGTAPYHIQWDNGDTIAVIQNLAAGLYLAIVTDSHGCTRIAGATLQPPAPIQLEQVNATLPSCFGASDGAAEVILTGGHPPYSVLWSNGAMGLAVTGLSSGNYSFIVFDDNNCPSDSLGFFLDSPGRLGIESEILPASAVDNMDGAVHLLSVEGGTPPYQFTWSNGVTTQDNTGLAPGTYELTLTDEHGCQRLYSFDVGFVVGIGNIPNDPIGLVLLPNPTRAGASAFLQLDTTSPQVVNITIGDVWGRLLFAENGVNISSTGKYELPNLPAAGIYWVRLVFPEGNKTQTIKWIKTE